MTAGLGAVREGVEKCCVLNPGNPDPAVTGVGGGSGGEVGVMQTLASSLLTEWKVVFPSVGPGEELDVINEEPDCQSVSLLFYLKKK